MRTSILVLLLLPFFLGSAAAQAPAAGGHDVCTSLYSPNLAESAKTQVLVLATPHLKQLKTPPAAGSLEPLLKVLQEFHPDVIAVEILPPDIIEDMERRGGLFGEVAEQFAGVSLKLGHEEQKLLSLTRRQAEEEAGALLRQRALNNAERDRLVALLVAAYDFDSAVLQWSYLPAEQQKASARLSPATVAQLDKGLTSVRDDLGIGVALARRLGLQRVAAIDDQFDARVYEMGESLYPGALEKLVGGPEAKAMREADVYKEGSRRLEAASQDGAALLSYYLWTNSVAYASADIAAQWGYFFRTQDPTGVDRARVAQWEARNLLIASHIREATAFAAGKRALVIIGAAHKPWLDHYLRSLLDVKVVQLADLPVGR